MLLTIIEIPRSGTKSQTRSRKILKLRCDECGKEWDRRWGREVSEQPTHCCSRKCARVLKSKDPDWRRKISESTKISMSKPEVREALERGIKRRDADPTFRQKLSTAAKRSFAENPNRAKKQGESLRARLADPEFHAKFIERQNDPKLREFRREMAKRRWSDVNNHEMMSVAIKASWASGLTGHGSPEWIAKQSAAQREVWLDASYRESHMGSNNPMSGRVNPWWQPWMTNHRDGNRWANAICKLCGGRCIVCGSQERVEAHHVAPRSAHPELQFDLHNGLALCSRCHDGAGNADSAHAILRTDPKRYEILMKELFVRRDSLLHEDS